MTINSVNPYLPRPDSDKPIVPKSVQYQLRGSQANPLHQQQQHESEVITDAQRQAPAEINGQKNGGLRDQTGRPERGSISPEQYNNLNSSAQFNPNWVAANQSIIDSGLTWNRGTAKPDGWEEQKFRSSAGHILNETKSHIMKNHEYPKILDGDLIVTDGTLKSGYSRQELNSCL